MAERARAIVRAGVPVMGHVGLTPQTATALGGYRAQGRTAERARQVLEDARALQEAGCFALVFEAIPADVTDVIMEHMEVPIIGIGAGSSTDGQVLVLHDLLGMHDGFKPKFVKRYADVKSVMVRGVEAYADEVRTRAFPLAEHTYGIAPEELDRLRAQLPPHRTTGLNKSFTYTGRHAAVPALRAEGARVLRPVRGSRRQHRPRGGAARADARALARPRELARDVLVCEQEGDRITHDIIQRLNSTFVTPIDREDIYALASALDDIVDFIEEVADFLGLYRIEAPMDKATEMARILHQSARAVAAAIPRLRTFKDIHHYTVEINRLENDGDRVVREALASLFERGIDPMLVIRWKDIFERLEDAIDSTETTANILEGIVIKNQ